MTRNLLSTALDDLRKLGYEWKGNSTVYGCHSDFSVMQTPHGETKMKVYWRSSRHGDRCPIGICPSLLYVVPTVALWFEKKPYLYIVPSHVLKELWIEEGKKLTDVGQFMFNLHVSTGEIERPSASILEYRKSLRAT